MSAGANALVGLGLVLGSVFAHEWGHYRLFRFCGVPVQELAVGIGPRLLWYTDKRRTRWSLRLLPIAGYTKPFEGYQERLTPLGDLLIAVAGPAVNLLLAAIAICADTFYRSEWLLWFAYVNSILAVFNLVPFWPLDGGRIFYAAIQLRLGSAKAKRAENYIKLGGLAAMVALNAYFIFGGYHFDQRFHDSPKTDTGAAR